MAKVKAFPELSNIFAKNFNYLIKLLFLKNVLGIGNALVDVMKMLNNDEIVIPELMALGGYYAELQEANAFVYDNYETGRFNPANITLYHHQLLMKLLPLML